MDKDTTTQLIELILPYQEGRAKALAESDGLFVKSLSIEYTRTFATGNFESAKFTVALWADRDGRNSLEHDLESLWQVARENLREQALPVLRERQETHRPPAKKAKQPDAPAATTPSPGPPATGAAPPAPVAQDGAVKSGTAELVKIACQADGKIEFYCQGYRWPFKDGRGAETVIALFDEALGWKAEHLAPGKLYELAGRGFLVDWQKPGKYYDVVRVHK